MINFGAVVDNNLLKRKLSIESWRICETFCNFNAFEALATRVFRICENFLDLAIKFYNHSIFHEYLLSATKQ